jgi:hypothetical protein
MAVAYVQLHLATLLALRHSTHSDQAFVMGRVQIAGAVQIHAEVQLHLAALFTL